MTVNELIGELQKFPSDTRVQIYDSEWGHIDITDIHAGTHTGALNGIPLPLIYIS